MYITWQGLVLMLSENDHLRLFDYLLLKLKERNIKILITPIAFWGNGYPEKDAHTKSFSDVYSKGPAVVNEGAIKAQENYLQQFYKHINPYTKLSYTNDPVVIATELNNEPHHSGAKERTTEYINRLAAAVRSTGWTKPVFYNISESPDYADAVVKANVDGHSFQWYPTGLVSNHTLKGNFLPNVDKYLIPFDTIPAFKNQAKMVYEFDAGDMLQSYMYPAIARSFRTAGFQWATQFAYDPMATAYANTEYQTHYVNLAYTPSKAISLMIAAKAFHGVSRGRSYSPYPADSSFGPFRVSYRQSLSEMNAPAEFYYSNTTTTNPVNAKSLQHIAGVGNSPIVKYEGKGAYFIDKISEGIWRLEVMPDAIQIRDPFEKASPRKEVTRIQWQEQRMQIMLPDAGADFTVSAVDTGNRFSSTATANAFIIQPGTYLIKSKANASFVATASTAAGTIRLAEFVAPKSYNTDIFVTHYPLREISSGTTFNITAEIAGLKGGEKISAEIRNSSGKWKTVVLNQINAYQFTAEVPAEITTPGVINYRIIVAKTNDFTVFPGNHKGDPYAWDAYENESYETFVAAPNTPINLFDANTDRATLDIYNPSWRDNLITYTTAEKSKQLVLKASMNKVVANQSFGWQQYIADKVIERKSEAGFANKLIVRARTSGTEPVEMKIALIDKDGQSFSTFFRVNNRFENIEIPFARLKPDSTILLPRPYPGFQPLKILIDAKRTFNIMEIDKVQVLFAEAKATTETVKSVEFESISIDK
jgi:hypothetical protein